MDESAIQTLLARLDGRGSDQEWAAALQLRVLGAEFPKRLLGRFRSARSWKVRCSCVYHAMRYARESEEALTLGKEAIRDRSKVVRYRGSMLLAYAQRKDTLPALRDAMEAMPDRAAQEDLRAAVDAIENSNQNYFVDRDHTGKAELVIE